MEARTHEVAQEIEDHFEKFRISDALMSVYKLIWDDFCSWFLEFVKPEYGQPISQATLEGIIDLFERNLQLVHPFMPFISEEIWHGLRDRKQEDFITTSRLFAVQTWEQELLSEMELIKETISAVRNFRVSKQISFKDAIDLFIKTDEEALFSRYQSLLKQMLNTASIEFVNEKVDKAGSIRVRANELYIPLGAVDVVAERAKIEKEIEYTEGFLAKVVKKLANERFVNSAPAPVVELERKKQADAEAQLEVLRNSLGELE